MKQGILRLLFFAFLISISQLSHAVENIEVLPFSASVYKDKKNSKVEEIIRKNFTAIGTDIFNFGVSNSIFWIKLTADKDLFLNKNFLFIEQSRFSISEMYHQKPNGKPLATNLFSFFKNNLVKNAQGITFALPDTITKGEIFLLKLKSQEAFITRISVITESKLQTKYGE